MATCLHCGSDIDRQECAGGKVWRASDGSLWCTARGPWQRHGVMPPGYQAPKQEREPQDDPTPVDTPVAERIQGYKPDHCRRPDKQPMTKAEAKAEALRMRGRGHRDVLAYRCTCNAWHVGNSRHHLAKRIRYALGMPQTKGRITR